MSAWRPSNVAIVYLNPAKEITCKNAQAIVGCRFVALATGGAGNFPAVKAAVTAKGHIFGVAMADSDAGTQVLVRRDGVISVKAGAILAAGDPVASDATGQAVAATGTDIIVGFCVADTASGANAPIALRG